MPNSGLIDYCLILNPPCLKILITLSRIFKISSSIFAPVKRSSTYKSCINIYDTRGNFVLSSTASCCVAFIARYGAEGTPNVRVFSSKTAVRPS